MAAVDATAEARAPLSKKIKCSIGTVSAPLALCGLALGSVAKGAAASDVIMDVKTSRYELVSGRARVFGTPHRAGAAVPRALAIHPRLPLFALAQGSRLLLWFWDRNEEQVVPAPPYHGPIACAAFVGGGERGAPLLVVFRSASAAVYSVPRSASQPAALVAQVPLPKSMNAEQSCAWVNGEAADQILATVGPSGIEVWRLRPGPRGRFVFEQACSFDAREPLGVCRGAALLPEGRSTNGFLLFTVERQEVLWYKVEIGGSGAHARGTINLLQRSGNSINLTNGWFVGGGAYPGNGSGSTSAYALSQSGRLFIIEASSGRVVRVDDVEVPDGANCACCAVDRDGGGKLFVGMSTGALGTTKLPPGAGAKLTPILDGASLTRNPNSALEALYVRTADAGRYVFAVASGSAVAAVSLFTDRVVAERWGHGCGVAWLGARRAPLDDGATDDDDAGDENDEASSWVSVGDDGRVFVWDSPDTDDKRVLIPRVVALTLSGGPQGGGGADRSSAPASPGGDAKLMTRHVATVRCAAAVPRAGTLVDQWARVVTGDSSGRVVLVDMTQRRVAAVVHLHTSPVCRITAASTGAGDESGENDDSDNEVAQPAAGLAVVTYQRDGAVLLLVGGVDGSFRSRAELQPRGGARGDGRACAQLLRPDSWGPWHVVFSENFGSVLRMVRVDCAGSSGSSDDEEDEGAAPKPEPNAPPHTLWRLKLPADIDALAPHPSHECLVALTRQGHVVIIDTAQGAVKGVLAPPYAPSLARSRHWAGGIRGGSLQFDPSGLYFAFARAPDHGDAAGDGTDGTPAVTTVLLDEEAERGQNPYESVELFEVLTGRYVGRVSPGCAFTIFSFSAKGDRVLVAALDGCICALPLPRGVADNISACLAKRPRDARRTASGRRSAIRSPRQRKPRSSGGRSRSGLVGGGDRDSDDESVAIPEGRSVLDLIRARGGPRVFVDGRGSDDDDEGQVEQEKGVEAIEESARLSLVPVEAADVESSARVETAKVRVDTTAARIPGVGIAVHHGRPPASGQSGAITVIPTTRRGLNALRSVPDCIFVYGGASPVAGPAEEASAANVASAVGSPAKAIPQKPLFQIPDEEESGEDAKAANTPDKQAPETEAESAVGNVDAADASQQGAQPKAEPETEPEAEPEPTAGADEKQSIGVGEAGDGDGDGPAGDADEKVASELKSV